jgi:DNA-binding HxlR family transcriptional regulator
MYICLLKVSSKQKVSSNLFVSESKPHMEKHHHSSTACQQKLSSIGDALYVIGGKWKLRIIVALQDGNKRFNELQRTVDGISARVLSNELKDLELNGFIKRQVYDEKPVMIEYELTGYSDTLNKVLKSLSDWGTMHRERIVKERKLSTRKTK